MVRLLFRLSFFLNVAFFGFCRIALCLPTKSYGNVSTKLRSKLPFSAPRVHIFRVKHFRWETLSASAWVVLTAMFDFYTLENFDLLQIAQHAFSTKCANALFFPLFYKSKTPPGFFHYLRSSNSWIEFRGFEDPDQYRATMKKLKQGENR